MRLVSINFHIFRLFATCQHHFQRLSGLDSLRTIKHWKLALGNDVQIIKFEIFIKLIFKIFIKLIFKIFIKLIFKIFIKQIFKEFIK